MAGQKASNTGRTASPAAASPAVKRGADSDPIEDPGQSGNLVDAGVAALILEESGGGPAVTEGDTGAEKSKAVSRKLKAETAAAGESDDNEETEETSEESDSDQNEGEERENEGDENSDSDGTDETDGTDEADQTAETDADQETEAEDETPAWAKKRFGEYSAERKLLKRQIADLEAKLNAGASTTATAAAPRAPLPVDRELLEVDTPEQLTALRQKYEDLEDWAIAHRDGIEADPDKPDAPSFTREEVAQSLLTARRALRQIPTREAQLSKVREYNARANELFPGFQEPDSEESLVLAHILRTVPEIKRLPNYKIAIGDMIAHERLRAKQAKAAAPGTRQALPGKPVVGMRKTPPALPGGPARAPSQDNSRSERLGKMRTRAFTSGSEADIANLLEASLSR